MYYTDIYFHSCSYTVLKYTLKQCFHSIFHLRQTSPNKMEHAYQPKAEQDWSKRGQAPHEALPATQGWKGNGQRRYHHHIKHGQQSKGNTIMDGLQQILTSIHQSGFKTRVAEYEGYEDFN